MEKRSSNYCRTVVNDKDVGDHFPLHDARLAAGSRMKSAGRGDSENARRAEAVSLQRTNVSAKFTGYFARPAFPKTRKTYFR
jgi:hypothetical protein